MFYDVSAHKSERVPYSRRKYTSVPYSGRKYTIVPYSGIYICNIYSVQCCEILHVFCLFLNKVNDPSQYDNDLNLFSYRAK